MKNCKCNIDNVVARKAYMRKIYPTLSFLFFFFFNAAYICENFSLHQIHQLCFDSFTFWIGYITGAAWSKKLSWNTDFLYTAYVITQS